jgi:hypothetical protein
LEDSAELIEIVRAQFVTTGYCSRTENKSNIPKRQVAQMFMQDPRRIWGRLQAEEADELIRGAFERTDVPGAMIDLLNAVAGGSESAKATAVNYLIGQLNGHLVKCGVELPPGVPVEED